MQFIFEESCGEDTFYVNNETYKYLFKARRHKLSDLILFRNLKDNYIYTYEVFNISKKEAVLNLIKRLKRYE